MSRSNRPALRQWLTHWVLIVIALSAPRPATAAVVLNEIHYHPVEEAAFDADNRPNLDISTDVHEFIELHNTAKTAVSLSGWRLDGGVQFVFPTNATIPAGGYVVVARDPDRLAAVPAYGLPRESVLGPWDGTLSNRGETVQLLDHSQTLVESVEYRPGFPWPATANALGADEDWTGVKRRDHQYRGRSLERISPTHPASDPANWVASPLLPGPSPGKANALPATRPLPVIVALSVSQATDGHRIIRSNTPARVECTFSSPGPIADVQLEWFVHNLNATNQPTQLTAMHQAGTFSEGRYVAELPGQTNRSIVRFRIRANRAGTNEVVSPRADDVARWHSYFVSPLRPSSTNRAYEILISKESLRVLRTNIAYEPKRATRPDPPGALRESWNATQPAVFVYDGHVFDVQMRHHGSQFRREEGRRSYKLRFPDYDLFDGQDSIFITDKDYRTQTGHAIFRAAGLPTSLTRWVDLYFNENAKLQRLEQEEYNQQMLDRWVKEQARLGNDASADANSVFYKSMGVGGLPGEGPFGPADGQLLPPVTNPPTKTVYWTPLQRYEQNYGIQNQAWRGHLELKHLIDSMWAARPNHPTLPLTNGVAPPSLRAWYAANWHMERELTHVVFANWMGFWDDNTHNYFLWHQGDGRWSQLPWDFDATIDDKPWAQSIYGPESGYVGNQFKLGAITTHWDEFKQLAWKLNNTLLHPDALVANGASPLILTWARRHFTNVNTLLKLGPFPQPARPENRFPANGSAAGPFSHLETSPYAHLGDPAAPHAATLWEIRAANGTYFDPVLRVPSTADRTRLPMPVDRLRPGERYFWRATHIDSTGHASVLSDETSFVFGAGSRGAIRLHEVLADNRTAARIGDTYPDYIELQNTADHPVEIGGWGLTDDLTRPFRFTFPVGTVLAAGELRLVLCDRRNTPPGLHTGFGLDSGGETIGLFEPDAEGAVLRDLVQFGVQAPDLSIGLDAGGAWLLNTPSPGAANVPRPLGDPSALRINEWMAASPFGDDWIELYNRSESPVALDGLALTDSADAPGRSPFAPLSFIGGNGFTVMVADGKSDAGAGHLSFRLSAAGSALILQRSNGTTVDSIQFGRQSEGISQGRLPDGTGGIHPLPAGGSPGTTNSTDANRDGIPDAWAESLGVAGGGADADSDGDGLSDREEFLAGTNPADPDSPVRLRPHEFQPADGRRLRLVFERLTGRGYRLERRTTLGDTPWEVLETFPAEPLGSIVTREVALSGETGFYRLYEIR